MMQFDSQRVSPTRAVVGLFPLVAGLPKLISICVVAIALGLLTERVPLGALQAQEPTTHSKTPKTRIGPRHTTRAIRPNEGAPDGPFQEPNHETTHHLELAEELLENGHYSDGLQLLDDIVQKDVKGEDFFLPPDPGESSRHGLKEEIQRLISGLPADGLREYETLFGAKAQHMLSEALAANDIEAVNEVARRYFNTKAGNQATLLVALWDLDHNQPLAAALCLERLRDSVSKAASDSGSDDSVASSANVKSANYEPALSALLAFCWMRGGQQARARDVLVDLKRKYPGVEIRIGSKSAKLFSDDSQAVAWLASNFGNALSALSEQALEWAIFRGDPARNATSAGGTPLMDPRWRVWTTENQATATASRQQKLDNSIPILPVIQPLAVGDVVLMRTVRGLLAVDFSTGKRVWEVRSPGDAQTDSANVPHMAGMPQQGDSSFNDRLWENATLGTLASDGKYVFMVEDPRPDGSSADQQRMVRQFGMFHPQLETLTNELAAYELRTQGKIIWRVGGVGEHRDFDFEPKLAGAYFLGPPLPLDDGKLYILAELRGEISLVVLDAKTGKLKWQQQLVSTDTNPNVVVQDSYRRISGATPSYADGVLVCPTSAGAVVAVDLATRKLLWGYEYPPGTIGQNQQIMNFRFQMMNGYIPPNYTGDRWADCTATIADGRVLITPVEGDQPLYCLGLIDGKLIWKMDRGDNAYVGGVEGGKVLLVGKHKVQAVSLADGREVWSLGLDKPTDEIADSKIAASVGALPAGRGFMSAGFYYLPLSTAEVACIDIEQGKIVSRTRSRKGYIPGNLICYKGDVISLGVDSLDAFYQLEPLRDRVAATLKNNPDDPESLALRGQIELNTGKLADAIRDIHRAYDKDTSDSARAVTRGLLVDTMLAALRSNFRTARVSVAELEKLISLDSEQAEFLRMLAEGLQQSGDRMAAVDAYLRLADLKWGQGEPESIEANWSVRRDRWVEARLESLYASASAAERSKIDVLLSERAKEVVASKNDKDLRAYINYFSFHPTADLARDELARDLSGTDSILERQLLLSELEQSTDPEQRRSAIAEMADLLKTASRPEEAAVYYRRLNTELANQVCLDGKTGKQIVDELSPDSPEVRAMNDTGRWPIGVVKHDGSRTAGGMNFPPPMVIPWQGARGPFFQFITVLYDMQQQIVGRDGLGRAKFSIPLSEAGSNRFAYQPMNPYFVSAKGHLLFANLGYQLLALDTLRPMNAGNRVVWEQELVDLSNNVFNSPIERHQVRLPWGTMKQLPQYSEAASFGVVGPITDRCVCIARSHDLTALDPLTGATLWTWHGVPQGADVFGDDDVIIVASPAGADATVLRTADGEQLGRCNVPPVDRRAGCYGRHVLTWRSSSGPDDAKIDIVLADPWKGQDQVLGTFSPFMKGTLVDDDALAILEPNNRFRILSLVDGRTLVDDRLHLDQQVDETIVEATSDGFLLFAKRPDSDRQTNTMQYGQYRMMEAQMPDSCMRLFTGSVFAFSRKTGKQTWSVPAQVDSTSRSGLRQYMRVVLDQGSELPVIVFLGVSRDGVQTGGEIKGSVLCLDKRTGRALLDEEVAIQANNGHVGITADRQANTVTINLSNYTFTLTFTDEPTPPEPPYQARLAKLAEMKAPLMGVPLKKVIDEIRRRAGVHEDSGDDSNSNGQ